MLKLVISRQLRIIRFFFFVILTVGLVLSENCVGSALSKSFLLPEQEQVVSKWFSPATMAHLKNPKNDEAIQAHLRLLLNPPTGISKPDCLDIDKAAQLGDSNLERGNLEDQKRCEDFFRALKNSKANTPPYLHLPDTMLPEARQAIFNRMMPVILANIQKRHENAAKCAEAIRTSSYSPAKTQLKDICSHGYKSLMREVIVKNLLAHKGNMDRLRSLKDRMLEENRRERFCLKFDPQQYTAENARFFRDFNVIKYMMQETDLPIASHNIEAFKLYYPFVVFLGKRLPPDDTFVQDFRDILFDFESKYAHLQHYFRMMCDNHDYYLELTQNRAIELSDLNARLLDKRMSATYREFEIFQGRVNDLIAQEYATVDTEVSEYYQAIQAAKQKAQQELKEKKQQKNQKQKERTRETMAQAAALAQELAKAEMERLEAQSAEQAAMQSSSVKRPKREYATNVGARHAWYWDSLKTFNATKEARENAQDQLSKEEDRAQSKASKSHAIDETKAAPAPVVGPSTVSTSTSEIARKIEPIVLSSNHYATYELLMTNKDCGLNIETVGNMLEGINGYMDPHRAGSRVEVSVRHIETGVVLTRIIHYHPKNGRNTLRPEQILDIQNLLNQAGYTQDRVIRNVGSAYSNTISSSSSSSASTSSKAQRTAPSNDDDGE